MAQKRILLIEDEKDIAELVRHYLSLEGYAVSRAATGEDGLRLARADRPSLVLLDLMLPGVDGLEVCRALKRDRATETIPIVMLTAKSEESDIVAGLELGADDYVTKPFSPKVLVARVRAVLRRRSRPAPADSEPLEVHGLSIHPGRHEVRVGGKPVELTATEFRLLRLLAGRPGWVFTRSQIVNAVRGEDYPVTERSVDVHIVGLRRKLGRAGECIETVRGVGYRFQEE
jgi:two-component system phosphate regulon response regulator PhoB